jgi:hypothetical protein
MAAVGLSEQRRERRITLERRCERAAEKAMFHDGATVSWCYLNDEGDELERMIPDSVQVSGSDSMDEKEEAFSGFSKGQIKKLITKPDIAGFGLNWQHCHHQTFFPSHSFEQYYQAVRRSWRFGQTHDVKVDLVTSEGESGVMSNLIRKSENAELLFQNLVRLMGAENFVTIPNDHNTQTKLPSWLA